MRWKRDSRVRNNVSQLCQICVCVDVNTVVSGRQVNNNRGIGIVMWSAIAQQ